MLIHIYIKNMALIDEININLDDHLNILTGETGAGKSILIDSVNLALGERVSKDIIRSGEEEALVELLFKVPSGNCLQVFEELGIGIGEDNLLLISRSISRNGRNICRINGRPVTVGMLKDVSSFLIDVHGQHEHQSLLNVSTHIDLLDRFCSDELFEQKKQLADLYHGYQDIIKSIEQISINGQERERRIDLLQFQLDEINNAKLKLGEEANLNSQRKVLSNSQKLISGIGECYELLQEGTRGEGTSVLDAIGQIVKNLNELSVIDSKLKPVNDMMETIIVQLEDASRDIRNYYDGLEHDPTLLNDIESRLTLIYNLKRKYGNSIEEILYYRDQIDKELDYIKNSQEKIDLMKKQLKSLEMDIVKLCTSISKSRAIEADRIQGKIEEVLQSLQLKNAKFAVSIERKDDFTDNGWDRVEFLISTNPGEKLKPLSKIASGGEMSRVMLAIKTVLADVDNIETLIFDEIDTGISGRAAQRVAEKLALISKKHQIICITHLPQIASMADQHYLIEKNTKKAKTTTRVFSLSEEEIIHELARLMGGVTITSTTIQNAKEMKNMANNIKMAL